MLLVSIIALAQIAVAPPPVATSALSHDAGGRPVIQATLNHQGPFDMVVDTAAQTSVLMPATIDRLGLKPLSDTMTVNGAIGAAEASLYPIDEFSTDLFALDHVAMLALPNGASTRAAGIVGMDMFYDRKLVVDRTHATLRIEPSAEAGADFVTVKGRVADSGLMFVPVTVDGVTIQALVDTGAGATIANLKVLEALGWAADDARLSAGGQIRGATLGSSEARMGQVTLGIGSIRLSNVPLAFSDIASDDGQPGIILGSDLLNLFVGYAVDFPRAELQIQTPPKTTPPVTSDAPSKS